MTAEWETCSCGAVLPVVAAPGHPYMRSTSSCWRAYNELATLTMGLGLAHVDAYAAQHFVGVDTDRRQRQSVAVHLTAICLGVEREYVGLDVVRSRLSRTVLPQLGLAEWPLLRQPTGTAPVTIVDLMGTATDWEDEIERWRESVWGLWEAEHARVREWATIAEGGW